MDLYLILGYLGSGKTTFLKNFLKYHGNKKVAVVVNDFGAQDVDGKILSSYAEIVKTVSDGSIFCSCRSDQFVSAVTELSKEEPDIVVVESSGLANPFTMLEVLDVIKRESRCPVRLMGVTALADAECFEKVVSSVHMARMQIACADIVLLNKCDLVSSLDADRVEELLLEINPNVEPIRTVDAECDFHILERTEHAVRKLPANIHDLGTQKFIIEGSGDTDLERLHAFSEELSRTVHRIKGFVRYSGGSYLYEYVNGRQKLMGNAGSDKNYLVILAVSGKNVGQVVDDLSKKYLPEWTRKVS